MIWIPLWSTQGWRYLWTQLKNKYLRRVGLPYAVDNPQVQDYFIRLSQETYEPHPSFNIPPGRVLQDGVGSDCQDRAEALADYLVLLGYYVRMVYTEFLECGHLAVLVEDLVLDPTHDLYGYPLEEYLEEEDPLSYYTYIYSGPTLR